MSDLQNQVINPFLEDIWGKEDKCVRPYGEVHTTECSCLFDYYSGYLTQALENNKSSFGENHKNKDREGLIKIVLEDILDEDIEEKAEQLLLMYKSYKRI